MATNKQLDMFKRIELSRQQFERISSEYRSTSAAVSDMVNSSADVPLFPSCVTRRFISDVDLADDKAKNDYIDKLANIYATLAVYDKTNRDDYKDLFVNILFNRYGGGDTLARAGISLAYTKALGSLNETGYDACPYYDKDSSCCMDCAVFYDRSVRRNQAENVVALYISENTQRPSDYTEIYRQKKDIFACPIDIGNALCCAECTVKPEYLNIGTFDIYGHILNCLSDGMELEKIKDSIISAVADGTCDELEEFVANLFRSLALKIDWLKDLSHYFSVVAMVDALSVPASQNDIMGCLECDSIQFDVLDELTGPVWDMVKSFLYSHKFVAAEPFLGVCNNKKEPGILLYINGRYVLICDGGFYHLKNIVKNNVLLTSFATSLCALVYCTPNAPLFYNDAKNRRDGMPNLNEDNLVGLTRCSAIRHVNDLNNLFHINAHSYIEAMPYYEKWYAVCDPFVEVKHLTSMDILLGYSYLYPNPQPPLLKINRLYTLTCDYRYDLSSVHAELFVNTACITLSCPTLDTIASLSYVLVGKGYMRLYNIRISKLAVADGACCLTLYVPAEAVNIVYDIVFMAITDKNADGRYKLDMSVCQPGAN